MAQHQLGHAGIEFRRIRHQEAQPHLAGAGAQSRAAREDQRAAHALRAAQDAQRAERALVDVARAAGEHLRQRCRQRGPLQPVAACAFGCIDAERLDEDVAAEVRSVRGQQAGFQREERDRFRRADRRRVRLAGISLEAGRDVECQDRRARVVCPVDEAGIDALDSALQADAEEAVDHESRPLSPCGGHDGSAVGSEGPVRRRSVRRKALRVARKDDLHVVIGAAQPTGRDERIAAVVAGSREHDDPPATLARQPCAGLGRGHSGALHQRRSGMPCLERAQLGDIENWRQIGRHRPIIVVRPIRGPAGAKPSRAAHRQTGARAATLGPRAVRALRAPAAASRPSPISFPHPSCPHAVAVHNWRLQ